MIHDTHTWRIHAACLTVLVLSVFLVGTPVLAETADLPRTVVETAEPPSVAISGRWLGPEGPLPFSSDEEILDFLRNADVVKVKQLSTGVNRSLKVALERDGVRANAVFRSVEIERQPPLGEPRVNRNVFRDHYVFEVAAYELNRLLGLDQIPPAVVRKVRGQRGSLQLWVEQSRTEASRIKKRQSPSNPGLWNVQKQVMRVFDNLIYNFDRNPGNMLFDSKEKLWYIDHTRSFKRLPVLTDTEALVVCDRAFFQRLRSVTDEDVRQLLDPYLETSEINAVLERRAQLVEMFDAYIRERGETAVLLDLEARIDPSKATDAAATDRRASLLDTGVWPVL